MTGYRGEGRGGGPLGKREAGGLEAGKLENEDGGDFGKELLSRN